MRSSIVWLQVGDLHMDEATDFQSRDRLEAIVAEANEYLVGQADFLYLPGDIANHGTPAQYEAVTQTLRPLRIPWKAIPGDHDFEPGTLSAFEAAVPARNRPEAESISGHRCIFLDIVQRGFGGPDFRLDMHNRNRLLRELSKARAQAEIPLMFMHAYPCDLACDGDELARTFADYGVAFVATGHTHYNEILNDGRVIYGATRSTSEIEEGGGLPGFSLVSVCDGVVSWRFKLLGTPWPFIQIVHPSDRRLVTQPWWASQVPRPGVTRVVVRSFGSAAMVETSVDGGPRLPMARVDRELWAVDVRIDEPGLHRISATCDMAKDEIDVLVRPAENIPKRSAPIALGHACHAIGPWVEAGIEGTQLGPNRNGREW